MNDHDERVNFESFGMGAGEPLKVRQTRDIRGSRIGVGFETLDRQLFDPERVYPHLAELGAKWARVQTGWNRCETELGTYDFVWLDRIVDSLIAVGVQPWFNLGFGNRLHMPGATHPSAVGCVPLYFGPEGERAWVRFVTAIAMHFRGRVRHWEVWNEPDTTNFWSPGTPSPSEYVRLLSLTVPPLRHAQPDAFVIGGATARLCPSLIHAYLEAGIAEWIDAYTFHPYRMVPEWHYREELAAARALFSQRECRIQLWQGENGCPAVAKDHNDEWLGLYHVTESVQAKWAARRILSDLAEGLELTSYFHATDLVARTYYQADGKPRKPVMMGLIDGYTYEPRDSFRAVQTLCNLFDMETRPMSLPAKVGKPASRSLDAPKIPFVAARSVTFKRRDQPLFAYWYPEDPQSATPAISADIHVYVMRASQLSDPVMIDPITQRVYPLKEADRSAGGSLVHFAEVPLADYPLIITDRTVL